MPGPFSSEHSITDARALAEKSQVLQTTIDSIGQGLSAFNADLKLVAWNRKFLELLGLDRLEEPNTNLSLERNLIEADLILKPLPA